MRIASNRQWSTRHCLRQLFAVILVHCSPTNPQQLWSNFQPYLSQDIATDSSLSQNQITGKVLSLIDQHLQIMGKSLKDFGFSNLLADHQFNNPAKEIQAERMIPVSNEDIATVSMLNNAQKYAFEKIMQKVNANVSGAFFIDGPGGTGKSFLYKALLAMVRSRGDIALATATSGAAASILPGGRTAHSRFKIPLHHETNSTCNLSK